MILQKPKLLFWVLALCAGIIAGTKRFDNEVKKIRISDNKRFFADQEGKPFFWLGDT